MPGRDPYRATISACYLGYITQAIVNVFAPLLFLTFQRTFSISLERIALLVTVNFTVQLTVDLLAARFLREEHYRPAVVAAHILCALGLFSLGTLPFLLPSPYLGLLGAVTLYAVGGGLIEVLISPIVESCPSERKAATMSLLHSFYCWGCVGVILLSTLFFSLLGMDRWPLLACLWGLLPLINAFRFIRVPIAPLVEEGHSLSISGLARQRTFWLAALLMVCAGAAEQGMSQWASAFAESGLGVSKTIGDLAGPCLFAVLMGLARVGYAKFSGKIHLQAFMLLSGLLCVVSYLLAGLSPSPVLGLLGCGLCGLSVGVMWPGTLSLSSAAVPTGGTALFALLALAGDLGCAGAPTLIGFVSGAAGNDLRTGLLAGLVFPLLLLLWAFRKTGRQHGG